MTGCRIGSEGAADRRRPSAVAVQLGPRVLVALLIACTEIEGDVEPLSSGGLDLGPDSLESAAPGPCAAEDYPIVFTSTRGSSASGLELYLMNLEGSVRELGSGPRFVAPVWSPDGRAVAFRHQVVAVPGATIWSEVQLIGADGNERVSLTAQETLPFTDESVLPLDGPSWSADGQTLAYAVAEGTSGHRVWLIPRVGGEPRRLLPQLEHSHHSPSWAPDGSRIAIVVDLDGVEDICLFDADADADAVPSGRCALDLTGGRVSRPRSLRWSRDGKRLAFSALDPLPPAAGGGDFEVYLLDVATKDITQFTHNDTADLHSAWSPDGTQLLITRALSSADADDPFDSQSFGLWRVPLDDPDGAELATVEGWINASADWFSGRCPPP